jgi:hypothetical protein
MGRKVPLSKHVYPLPAEVTFDVAAILRGMNAFAPEAPTEFYNLLVVGRLGKRPLTNDTGIRVVLVGRQRESDVLGFEWKDFSLGFLRDLEAVGLSLAEQKES